MLIDYEKYFWFFIRLTLSISTLNLVASLWKIYQLNPTITSLASTNYEIENEPFPGVAVCSINKISKKRAKKFAQTLSSATNISEEVLSTYLPFLGSLFDYDLDLTKVSEYLAFQKILDDLELDIRKIIEELAVPCEELLKTCHWKGQERNCSELFQLRLTFDGHCCLFNYVKNTTEKIDKYFAGKTPEKPFSGLYNGLYIEVNNIVEDYFYTILSSVGVNLHIFSPADFPDRLSGGLITLTQSPNSENFLEVVPKTVKAVEAIKSYSIESRNCMFNFETETQFGNAYTNSDCYLDCRIQSMLAICDCVPFFVPFARDASVCTLSDIACLNKYKDKWSSYSPYNRVDQLLPEEQNSLRCDKHCYSNCEETTYMIYVTSFPKLNSTSTHNTTITYLYMGQRFLNLYRQDVTVYWYEIISGFGGLCGLVLGVSFISFLQTFTFWFLYILNKLLN